MSNEDAQAGSPAVPQPVSTGDIVLVKGFYTGGVDTHPAIVTRPHDDDTVDVTIFQVGGAAFPANRLQLVAAEPLSHAPGDPMVVYHRPDNG